MDGLDFARYIGALLVTLGILCGAAVLVRRFGPRLGALGGLTGPARPEQRVATVQTLPLDARRRLAVVRFGGKDHLLLLGAQSETIIAETHAPWEDEA